MQFRLKIQIDACLSVWPLIDWLIVFGSWIWWLDGDSTKIRLSQRAESRVKSPVRNTWLVSRLKSPVVGSILALYSQPLLLPVFTNQLWGIVGSVDHCWQSLLSVCFFCSAELLASKQAYLQYINIIQILLLFVLLESYNGNGNGNIWLRVYHYH